MDEINSHQPRKIKLPLDFVNNSPPIDAELLRVTVLIGANGSGKTKLLRAIRQAIIDKDGVLATMMFRQLNAVERIHIGAPQPLKAATDGYDLNRGSPGHEDGYGRSQFDQAFHVLNADDNVRRINFIEECERHEKEPDKFARPKLPAKRIDEVFRLFENLFGLKLTHDMKGTGEVFVTPALRGAGYPTNALSGGESWALSVLPDFVLFKDLPMTIFVDEPESYFNESLAISFWSQIEAARPNWRFVYATHNVEFASRPGVEKILLLRSSSEEPIELKNAREIPIEDHKRILGYAPRLVKSERTLFVEGDKGSIDELFYPAILDDASVLIFPLKGCQDVIAAVKGDKVWERVIRDGVIVRGVIDRDYRSEDQLKTILSPELHILELHDLEAYLCIPSLLKLVADCNSGSVRMMADYEAAILDWAQGQKQATTVRHLNGLLGWNVGQLAISLPPSGNYGADGNMLLPTLLSERTKAIEQLKNRLSDAALTRAKLEVTKAVDAAINGKDIPAILRLFNGKDLFEHLRPMASLQDKEHAMRVIVDQRLVGRVPEMERLRSQLRSLLKIVS